jgi:hypothetical protein
MRPSSIEPSFDGWERRPRSAPKERLDFKGFALAVVVGILVAFLAWELGHPTLPQAHADVLQDDHYICTHLSEYRVEPGQEGAIRSYCDTYGK